MTCPNCNGQGFLYHGVGIKLPCRQCQRAVRIEIDRQRARILAQLSTAHKCEQE